jgi:hypothetical protein
MIPRPSSCPSHSAVDAFVACGGSADKTGHVARRVLVKIIKEDFGLQIDIEQVGPRNARVGRLRAICSRALCRDQLPRRVTPPCVAPQLIDAIDKDGRCV